MTAATILPMPPGTIATRYPLPPGSDIIAALGASVATGDVLAHAPMQPVYLSVPARRDGDPFAMPQAGARVEAEQSVMGERRGLRAPRVVSPVRGTVTRVAADGAMAITPDGDMLPIHARHAGTVVAITQSGIVVAVPAQRIRFAYAAGCRDAEIVLDAPPEHGRNHHRGRVLLLPHIADRKGYTAAMRASGGTLIVGAVADAVAWDICTKYDDDLRGAGHGTVIVLAGPGDAAHGQRALQPLLESAPRVAFIHHVSRTLAIVPLNAGSTEGTDARPSGNALRDPAHWLEPVTLREPPRLATTDDGVRVWAHTAASAARGEVEVPTANLVSCQSSIDG